MCNCTVNSAEISMLKVSRKSYSKLMQREPGSPEPEAI